MGVDITEFRVYLKPLMTTNGAIDQGQSGSCADPKQLFGKVVSQEGRIARWDAMIGRIGVVSHHLQSLLGAIKLTDLRVLVCKVEYFDVQIGETLLYKQGV